MKLEIKYFGMVEEVTGCDSEELALEMLTVRQLSVLLKSKYPKLDDISFQIAVNQEIKQEDFKIKEDSEVALLPPFAGG